MNTHTFLGNDIELLEFNIETADKIQAVLTGDSDITKGEMKVGMGTFKKAQYMTVELGTKDPMITESFIKKLPAKQAKDVQELYEAIQELNGL